jgi:hypothetical protein
VGNVDQPVAKLDRMPSLCASCSATDVVGAPLVAGADPVVVGEVGPAVGGAVAPAVVGEGGTA